MNHKVEKSNKFPEFMKSDEVSPIRIRIRHPKTFDKSYGYKPVALGLGVIAIIGIQKGQDNIKVQTLLFNTNSVKGKTWSLKKAKKWLKENKQGIKSKVFISEIIKAVKKPAPKLLDTRNLEKAVIKLNNRFSRLSKK